MQLITLQYLDNVEELLGRFALVREGGTIGNAEVVASPVGLIDLMHRWIVPNCKQDDDRMLHRVVKYVQKGFKPLMASFQEIFKKIDQERVL